MPFSKARYISGFALVKRFWREYLSYHKLSLGISLLCMLSAALCTMAIAKSLEPIFDDIFTQHNASKLVDISLYVLLIFSIKGVASYGENFLMASMGQRIIVHLQQALFGRILRLDLHFLHTATSGRLASLFLYDVQTLREAFSQLLVSIGKNSFTLVFLVGLMFYQDWFLALCASFVFPLAVLPLRYFAKRIRKIFFNTQHTIGHFQAYIQQIFQGLRIVKAYRMEGQEEGHAGKLLRDLLKLNIKTARVRSAAHPMMEMLGGIAIVVVIFYGGSQVIQGERTTGMFISFLTAFLLSYEPLKKLVHLNTSLQEGLSALSRLFYVLDLSPEIKDLPDARPLVVLEKAITFRDVTFTYPGGNTALKNFSCTIPLGQKVAFVGPSGAGKSTLFNLLLRFYAVDAGDILIDDCSITSFSMGSLRDQMALVNQDATLFNETITQNILYGCPDASQAEVEEAARRASAHDFILACPQGYDTVVGENSVKLSGGQRQRIALARAFLKKKASILLLDEATSSLDTQSEHQIRHELEHLARDKTTLIIAHRLSTVENADRIIVMDKGEIVEQGSHEELLAHNRLYARLIVPQLVASG